MRKLAYLGILLILLLVLVTTIPVSANGVSAAKANGGGNFTASSRSGSTNEGNSCYFAMQANLGKNTARGFFMDKDLGLKAVLSGDNVYFYVRPDGVELDDHVVVEGTASLYQNNIRLGNFNFRIFLVDNAPSDITPSSPNVDSFSFRIGSGPDDYWHGELGENGNGQIVIHQ
jgi:hypothetical protein